MPNPQRAPGANRTKFAVTIDIESRNHSLEQLERLAGVAAQAGSYCKTDKRPGNGLPALLARRLRSRRGHTRMRIHGRKRLLSGNVLLRITTEVARLLSNLGLRMRHMERMGIRVSVSTALYMHGPMLTLDVSQEKAQEPLNCAELTVYCCD